MVTSRIGKWHWRHFIQSEVKLSAEARSVSQPENALTPYDFGTDSTKATSNCGVCALPICVLAARQGAAQ